MFFVVLFKYISDLVLQCSTRGVCQMLERNGEKESRWYFNSGNNKLADHIVISFLRFIVLNVRTIYAVIRQTISAYVEYKHDSSLKPALIDNHLRAFYAFIVFLIDQGISDQTIMQRTI